MKPSRADFIRGDEMRLRKRKLMRLKQRRATVVRLIYLLERASQQPAAGKVIAFPSSVMAWKKRFG